MNIYCMSSNMFDPEVYSCIARLGIAVHLSQTADGLA